jgi:hypothetical protein
VDLLHITVSAAMARKSVKKSTKDEQQTSNNDGDAPQPSEATKGESAAASGGHSTAYRGLPKGGAKHKHRAPTVSDIIVDPVTQLAAEHWAGNVKVTRMSDSALFRASMTSLRIGAGFLPSPDGHRPLPVGDVEREFIPLSIA